MQQSGESITWQYQTANITITGWSLCATISVWSESPVSSGMTFSLDVSWPTEQQTSSTQYTGQGVGGARSVGWRWSGHHTAAVQDTGETVVSGPGPELCKCWNSWLGRFLIQGYAGWERKVSKYRGCIVANKVCICYEGIFQTSGRHQTYFVNLLLAYLLFKKVYSADVVLISIAALSIRLISCSHVGSRTNVLPISYHNK